MADKTDDKEEKLVAVGDGADESAETLETELKKNAEAEASDERVGQEEETAEKDDDVDTSDGREAIRASRRAERKRRREQDARNRRELNFLRQRNEALERRQSELSLRQEKQETLSTDQRVGQLDGQIREAEEIHAAAISKNDGATATEALRVRSQLENARNKIVQGKEKKQEKEESADRVESTEPRVSHAAVKNGREWVKRNPWFDPELTDEDSYLTRAIEERLAREGELTADDPEYWQELDRRLAKRLPDVVKKKPLKKKDDIFNEDDDDLDDEKPEPKRDAKKPRGPVFSVGGRTRSLGSREVFINAERRKALEEAGVWDDPVQRERYLKSYKRYDDDARRNS